MAAGRTIFISYRQSDSLGHAGHIHDALGRHFGRHRVFRDIPAIPPGADWVQYIRDQLAECGAVVAVIGPRWVSAHSGGLRRLEQPDDTLRRELAQSLASGIAVVPVLVAGAHLPRPEQLPEDLKPLLQRHALTLHEEDLEHGLQRLIERLEELLHPAHPPRSTRASASDPVGLILAALAGGANLLLGGPPWVALLAAGIVFATWIAADQLVERRAFRSWRSHR